jgi:hypothetical protein
MDRTPVTSSDLSSVGYDEESSTLEIEFKKGAIYQYSGVPEDEYQNLMGASSVGRYFNSNIKNRYSYIKL